MARVAILILNYNGEEQLKRFLPTIISNSPDSDIIIGDNFSDDNSIELLESLFPDVRVIKLDKNYGYAEGYNRLISQVENEYVALVNSDIEATPNWLISLISTLDSDASIAAVQPKILSYNQRSTFEYAGAAGGYIDQYGYPFCRGRIFNTIEEDTGQYNDSREIFWASGACFIVRKSIFQELNGFDKDFFAHMEEIDLNWRMHSSGYKVMYSSESTVYHLGGGTLSYDNPRKTYLNYRNGLTMLIKNLPEEGKYKTLLIRWLMDISSIILFLGRLQFRNVIAIFQAHTYVLFNLNKLFKKRPEVKEAEKLSRIIKPKNFSLVWQYYVKKRRYYSELIPD